MGILRSIETGIERVVEGTVGRAFRASVQPVEIARKLAKELEDGTVVSVNRTYAPNEYTVYLHPKDRTVFSRVRDLAARRARRVPRRPCPA